MKQRSTPIFYKIKFIFTDFQLKNGKNNDSQMIRTTRREDNPCAKH